MKDDIAAVTGVDLKFSGNSYPVETDIFNAAIIIVAPQEIAGGMVKVKFDLFIILNPVKSSLSFKCYFHSPLNNYDINKNVVIIFRYLQPCSVTI